MLNPARFWVVLFKFLMGDTDDLAPFVEDDSAGARGSLVNGEDGAFFHGIG
jgi:hypothetical protein